MTPPAYRPVHATPQQRANALAWVIQTGRAGMRATYADQRDAVADRIARMAELHGDDPEVAALVREVGDV